MARLPPTPWQAALLLLCLAATGAARPVVAQSVEGLEDRPHIMLGAGVGGQLRLGTDATFAQEGRAPTYLDLTVGASFPLGGYSIGGRLGASTNVEGDGGYTEPVFPWQQWSLTPALAFYIPLGPDWLALAHAGPSFALQGASAVGRDDDRRSGVSLGSAGMELGATAAYRVLAGTLAYAELDLNLWIGEVGSRHWVSALEVGVMLDYEVLP